MAISVKLVLTFVISTQLYIITAQQILKTPKLNILRVGDDWKNFTYPVNPVTNKLALHSHIGDDLSLECDANYPIQWNFTGFLSPPEIVKFLPAKRNQVTNKYTIQLAIFFLDAQKFINLGASVRIACEMVGHQSVRDELFVFVRGNDKMTLVTPLITTVVDSTLIPCATKDPTLETKLYLRNSDGNDFLINDNTLRYIDIEGFLSNVIFEGVYTCLQDSYPAVTITALATPTNLTPSRRNFLLQSYDFSPKTDNFRAFTEETIEFHCSSKSQQPVNIIVDRNNITVSYNNISQYNQVVRLTSIFKVGARGKPAGAKGKAYCFSGTNNAETIMEWSYEFVETPELFLNNFEGEVDCFSNASPKMVQTVRCKTSMDCQFMRYCLKNETFCNFKKQKQFYAQTDSRCFLQKTRRGKACTSVPYSHLNGLAQCSVTGLVKTWEYFVSLDFLKYSNWKDAPERELIRMDEISTILYTNHTTQFFCAAVFFLFADSISFEIKYENGSMAQLVGNMETVNISNPGGSHDRKIDEFNVIGILDIKLPIDTVGVTCIAPWWNETGGLRTSRNFETRHLLVPIFDEVGSTMQNKETFFIGETNRRLTCFAKGEPQPKYEWYYWNQNDVSINISAVFPELKTSLGSNGEGYLEFPKLDSIEEKRYSGKYQCNAVNSVGKAEKIFRLNVEDEPISGSSVIYIISVVVVLLVLAIVLAILFVLQKRYMQAKELLRNLTDNEIQDFFQGRPELVTENNQYNGNNVDVVDFLPFKSEYEISLNDLQIDLSEKNLLGTGQFAYVIRGKVISKNQPVAIKISKSSADVTLFKSLLSEIKIMIYIGEHENIVALIGVCTESIKNRSIHIATEICETGSLEQYLRNSRSDFLDLMNVNQQIEMSVLTKNRSELLNTLDLIKFSMQIAKGMEYLSYKSIIHADLAARNVLLTSNKTVKISDFGLSKKLYESSHYVKNSKSPLPWRWMAIESLSTLTFSMYSDIWAYGATLFEIFTLGEVPFPNEEWTKEFVARLSSGMRMGRPKYSTQDIYSKITACWEKEPESRPHFTSLRVYFEELLKQYENFPDTRNNSGSNSSKQVNITTVPSNPPQHDRNTHDPSTGESLHANFSPGFLNNHNVNAYSNTRDTNSLSSSSTSTPAAGTFSSPTRPYKGGQFPLQEKHYSNMPN